MVRRSAGPSTWTSAPDNSALVPDSAVLFDCDIIASNSNGQDCYGVQGTGLLSDGANIPCVMTLIKCRIHVANSGDGATYAIAANGADNGNGVVICYGCDFDRTLTNGNVIDLPLSALPVELKGLGASGTFSDPDSASPHAVADRRSGRRPRQRHHPRRHACHRHGGLDRHHRQRLHHRRQPRHAASDDAAGGRGGQPRAAHGGGRTPRPSGRPRSGP